WNPEGPYDTGELAGGERYIGWHFNTGKRDAPTSFAEAGKYHNQFYRGRILHHLLERGKLTDALDAWKKEAQGSRPHTDLSIAGLDPRTLRDPNRPPVVQRRELVLQTRLTGIHPARVEKVQWRLLRKGEKGWEPVSALLPLDGTDGVLKV